jgi:hypothetical protein
VQLAFEPEPLSMQLDEPKSPLPPLLQATVPVGVSGVPGDVSVTVAVHEKNESWSFEQLTLVEVDRCVTGKLGLIELPKWSVSPV